MRLSKVIRASPYNCGVQIALSGFSPVEAKKDALLCVLFYLAARLRREWIKYSFYPNS